MEMLSKPLDVEIRSLMGRTSAAMTLHCSKHAIGDRCIGRAAWSINKGHWPPGLIHSPYIPFGIFPQMFKDGYSERKGARIVEGACGSFE